MEVERGLPMGVKSKLNVSECREAVLSLLRREEPAGVPARRFDGGFLFGRAVPLGLRRRGSNELLRGPFSLGRRSERPSPGAFCSRTQGLFEANAYRFVYSQEPHAKPQKLFPLELRAKTGKPKEGRIHGSSQIGIFRA